MFNVIDDTMGQVQCFDLQLEKIDVNGQTTNVTGTLRIDGSMDIFKD